MEEFHRSDQPEDPILFRFDITKMPHSNTEPFDYIEVIVTAAHCTIKGGVRYLCSHAYLVLDLLLPWGSSQHPGLSPELVQTYSQRLGGGRSNQQLTPIWGECPFR